jgi:hypothetical protein
MAPDGKPLEDPRVRAQVHDESRETAAALEAAAAQAAATTPDESAPQAAGGVIAEAVGLATALGKLATAEASASVRETRRAVSLKLAGTIVAVPAYAFLVTSLLLALTQWLDSAAAAFAIVGGLHAALVAWLWRGSAKARARVGFPRTKRALAAMFGHEETPT